MTSKSYSISTQAYAKAIMHCAKYPSSTVHGILLTDPKSSPIRVVDAVPVAHLWTDLTPIFEVALQQVQIYAESKNLKVGGYYVAYENVKHNVLSPSGKVFADTVLKLNPDSLALVIDNELLSPENTSTPATIAFASNGNGGGSSAWEKIQVFSLDAEESGKNSKQSYVTLENKHVLAKTANLLQEHSQELLGDFDSHLESPSVDWLQNTTISEKINVA
ncbi:hypothetical protein H4219_001361 [Mycoemilia scoparia]|uniref:MPN domain-containing protein n=1 Tax=Mycoemilia scoparia TaxID=417184 RepID=A0A9W8A3P0_9FUNG|nr:hypothetical protein H4219_001361 [Mycoemilia scoparia]